MTQAKDVFFNVNDKGFPEIIDTINPLTGKSSCCGQSLEEMRARYPDIAQATLYEVVEKQEDLLRTAPEMIAEDRWMEALEMLPPSNWVRQGQSESFKFAEHYTGRITSIYARVCGTYWTFMDRCDVTHQQILERISLEVRRRTPA